MLGEELKGYKNGEEQIIPTVNISDIAMKFTYGHNGIYSIVFRGESMDMRFYDILGYWIIHYKDGVISFNGTYTLGEDIKQDFLNQLKQRIQCKKIRNKIPTELEMSTFKLLSN